MILPELDRLQSTTVVRLNWVLFWTLGIGTETLFRTGSWWYPLRNVRRPAVFCPCFLKNLSATAAAASAHYTCICTCIHRDPGEGLVGTPRGLWRLFPRRLLFPTDYIWRHYGRPNIHSRRSSVHGARDDDGQCCCSTRRRFPRRRRIRVRNVSSCCWYKRFGSQRLPETLILVCLFFVSFIFLFFFGEVIEKKKQRNPCARLWRTKVLTHRACSIETLKIK